MSKGGRENHSQSQVSNIKRTSLWDKPSSPHLCNEEDALQEHEVLMVFIYHLLINKVPRLQIWMV